MITNNPHKTAPQRLLRDRTFTQKQFTEVRQPTTHAFKMGKATRKRYIDVCLSP